jgi:hypothetical protein
MILAERHSRSFPAGCAFPAERPTLAVFGQPKAAPAALARRVPELSILDLLPGSGRTKRKSGPFPTQDRRDWMRGRILAVGLLALATCAPQTPRSEGRDADAVGAILTDIGMAVANDDPARASAHYGLGAIIVRPGRSIVISPTVHEYYQHLADDVDGSITYSPPTLIGASRSGDIAYVLANYVETGTTYPTDGEGTSLIVFTRQYDDWVIIAESRTPVVATRP